MFISSEVMFPVLVAFITALFPGCAVQEWTYCS